MRIPPNILETVVSGEVFTHRVLWTGCQCQLRVAREESTSSWYFYLTAMLMGYMTFEAYINFLGSRLQPELWKGERTEFRAPPYNGARGKLLKLCELHSVPYPDKGRRPFQSIIKLNALRDLVAHGKPEIFEVVARHVEGTYSAMVKSTLEQFVSGKKAEETIGDLKTLIESLHAAFTANEGTDLLLPLPLDGTLAMSIA